jgi:hypothetical protein
LVGRWIEFFFPESDVVIRAELLVDLAPRTCEAVWSVLPDERSLKAVEGWPEKGRVHHGIYAGPEIFVLIPPARVKPPIENLTLRPRPGDVVLAIIPATVPRWIDVKGEFWELALFYDEGGNLWSSGPEGRGWEASLFAQVRREDLALLHQMGRKIRSQGEERVVVRRLQ